MEDFVEALGGLGEVKDSVREYTMANDFAALAAAWRCAMDEGAVARKLSEWRLPCLIYAGTEDVDFFPDAQRVAKEIPGARFLALEGLSHLEAHANVIDVLPHIRALLSQS
jgi:pimeloyl-ACP methyl ester carboxylesterase